MRTGPGACDLSSPSRANYLPNHKRLHRAIDSSHVDRTGTVTPRLLSRQTSADTHMYSWHARASRGLSRREWHVSSTACVTRPPSIRALNLVPAHDRSRYGSRHTGHLTAGRLDACAAASGIERSRRRRTISGSAHAQPTAPFAQARQAPLRRFARVGSSAACPPYPCRL